MKKTYIAPTTLGVKLSTEMLIAESLESLGVNTEGESVDRADAWVKGNTSNPSYNVWDDDWSKN